LGLSGLPFLGFIVSGIITVSRVVIRHHSLDSSIIITQYVVYCLYQKYHIGPRYAKAGGNVAPEIRLEIGLIASLFIPTSVLMFGFTSKASISWIVPVIGAALYLPGIFLNFQSILMYITMAYPNHSASVLAGNDLFRSAIASVFPYVDPISLLFMYVSDAIFI
jgi:DHA1 family multidrug resistance protein-like MFS transporter